MSALHLAGHPEIPLAALAKREEELFVPYQPTSIRLSRHDPVLRLIQRIRDETHRFAITFQRKRRSNSLKSVLESIPGVGPLRIKRLYQHFKVLPEIRLASVQDIAKIGGMPESIAHTIKATLEGLDS